MCDKDVIEAYDHSISMHVHSCPCMSQSTYSPGASGARRNVYSELSPFTPFPNDVTLIENHDREDIERITSAKVSLVQPGAMKPCQLTLQRATGLGSCAFPGMT